MRRRAPAIGLRVTSSHAIAWVWIATSGATLGGCASDDAAAQKITAGVAITLALPHGALDPQGYASVDVVIHVPGEPDDTRNSELVFDASNQATFDLGTIEPRTDAMIEATLRNDSGAAVGYGRSAVAADLGAGTKIIVPVRRPILYIAGTVSRDISTTLDQNLQWTEVPATFADLSSELRLDGKTLLGTAANPAVMTIGAGPNLYLVQQPVMESGTTGGALTGNATLVPIDAASHGLGQALPGGVAGGVLDSAGTDDGATVVLGTTTQLAAVDTATGNVRPLAQGAFARVAIVATATGAAAIAIKNRGTVQPTCTTAAELWWAPLDGSAATLVAIGGFADVAADRGHAYYVDACTRDLGELTATGAAAIRGLGDIASATARPSALAVSNGQAYVGLDDVAATTSLLVTSLPTEIHVDRDASRVLWSEGAQQVIDATDFDGVQRQLNATGAAITHLEIGAGGDYIALTTSAHFHGDQIKQVGFPDTTIDTEELRVFDAATGGIVQRYRSWCDGVLLIDRGNRDIENWGCAAISGQTAPDDPMYEHHLDSMTFAFGKK